jgi:hypothetical protein
MSLGRPRRIWENNIKMEPKYILWKGADWIGLAYDRLVLLNKLID